MRNAHIMTRKIDNEPLHQNRRRMMTRKYFTEICYQNSNYIPLHYLLIAVQGEDQICCTQVKMVKSSGILKEKERTSSARTHKIKVRTTSSGWHKDKARTRSSAHKDKVRYNLLSDVQIDDPVHEVETGEAHREEDPAIFINIRRGHSTHFIQVLFTL